MYKFIFPVLLALLVLAPVSGVMAAAPAPDTGSSVLAVDAPAAAPAAAVNSPLPADVAVAALGPHYGYELMAPKMQSMNIELDTTQLFAGAQLMIDALSSPYLLIAGLGLGVAVLGAIMGAVRKVRL